MPNHTYPGGDQAHMQQLGADEGAKDPDAPHAADAEHKRKHRVAHTLHHALNHNGYPVEGFRHRHHTQHCRAQGNHHCIL